MQQFKDADGRTWSVRLTVGMMRRLKESGLDLMGLGKPPEGKDEQPDNVYFRLYFESDALYTALDVITKKERGELTIEELLDEMDGDALGAFRDALMEEWKAFCRASSSPQLQVIELMEEEVPKLMTMAHEASREAIDESQTDVREKIRRQTKEAVAEL